MIKKKKEKSVFILGAGASYNYGYPLGTGLRQNIIKNYNGVLQALQRQLLKEKPNFHNASLSFIDQFNLSSDTSIDIFLSKFSDFEFEGKMAIIYSILQAESTSKFREDLANYKSSREEINDDWMWHLYDKITKEYNITNSINEINFDHISFVTFNYDRSLEYFLSSSFKNGFNFKQIGGTPKDLLDKIRIEHVYGKVVDLEWEDNVNSMKLQYRSYNVDQHRIDNWLKNIRVIYDRKSPKLDDIYPLLRNADQIYFLGFGYDDINLDLLGFPDILSPHQKIYGTAYKSFDEEIEHYRRLIRIPGLHHDPRVINCNCTELLRRFYFVD